MLTDPSVIETIKARATIIKTLRTFFESKSFVEVQTPILSGQAGGATARPFSTIATEFSDGRDLALRIAPELWLKRLIIGGMDRVFEIGPSFRNEGLDKTHNPEFSTCEFYAVGHGLHQLMQYTEDLLHQLARAVGGLNYPRPSNASLVLQSVREEFQILDFLPALSHALGRPLPDLHSPTAREEFLAIFQSKDLPLPPTPTLPRLLDKLSSIYLEPQSLNGPPTWIINIPNCLSPLAKSYHCNTTSTIPPQEVAARAELFINGKEVVNCYEEENSPIVQRRKFLEQQLYARQSSPASPSFPSFSSSPAIKDEEVMAPDESYLQALEWGLPPTGGWGCGIDRLVMLFTGRERISDVLTFGSLRHVTHRVQGRDKETTSLKPQESTP
ncbi:lysyl-tRNA synthetase, class II [Exophiala aquamarina CBS 119918]|uniref:Lysyl-tRNA synthetase, class II n=1 Tax=Exophiala aquamarina CBS 119918 TaxID=1182545 RepID=A0A072Q2X7_9EURO|nr:lysyl-tRNA synthetase, class II [Exophiala aquamarina CBS 119918]KEF62250.1 lysyl-tRNA synthetase, class II [Exophiala aquamarina CBS 119918]